MNTMLEVTIFASVCHNLCTADNISGKNSLRGLVGSQNDAHFGKQLFLLVDTFQHIVYGHESEVYEFTFWFENVSCSKGFSKNCDIRACGAVPDATTYCDETENPAICKCKFPSSYPRKCGQPKLVLETKTYYYGKDETPESETFVTTQNFIATCTVSEGETVPPTPEPAIKISQGDLANGNAGLQATISITQYVQVPGLPVYFWTVQSISIRITKTYFGMFLENITGKEYLFEMLKDLNMQIRFIAENIFNYFGKPTFVSQNRRPFY